MRSNIWCKDHREGTSKIYAMILQSWLSPNSKSLHATNISNYNNKLPPKIKPVTERYKQMEIKLRNSIMVNQHKKWKGLWNCFQMIGWHFFKWGLSLLPLPKQTSCGLTYSKFYKGGLFPGYLPVYVMKSFIRETIWDSARLPLFWLNGWAWLSPKW